MTGGSGQQGSARETSYTGESHYLSEFVERNHRADLLDVARRTLFDKTSAEDCVQDALLRIHRYAETYTSGRPLVPWILRIVKNIARDYNRKRLVRSRFVNVEPATLEILAGEAHTQEEQENTEDSLVRHIDSKLLDLPEHYARPFSLYGLEGKSYEQISQEMGIPVGTVKSRIGRARQKLRQTVEFVRK